MDVVVFELGARRCAVDLRHVQEVIALGPVTPVPTAPPAVVGAINVHGHVVSLLDLGALGGGAPSRPLEGHTGILLEVGNASAVLHVTRVEGVTKVDPAAAYKDAAADAGLPGVMVPARDGPLVLLDLERALDEVVAQVGVAAERVLPRSRREGSLP